MINNNLLYASPAIPGIQALSCENDFSFGDHIHSGYVLWVNSGGCEYFTLGQKSDILEPGSVSVIEPGVVHANRPTGKGARHLRSLYLEMEFFKHLDTMYAAGNAEKLFLPTTIFDNSVCWQRLVLLHEAVVTGCDQMAIEQLVLSLFNRMFQIYPASIPDLKNCSGRDKRLGTIIEYMRANLADQLSLNDLAKLLDCTSYHVIRIFKAEKGMSPHAYLIQLRLEAARQQLDFGKPISDAALLTGFSDQSHLTRKFKQRYGLTPGSYLAQK